MPDKSYKAQEAYAKRNGLVSKAYKLKNEVVVQFKAACDSEGKSQAAVLQQLMTEYIDSIKSINP